MITNGLKLSMKSKGIRILDSVDDIVSVELPDILIEIQNGDSFNWSILFLDMIGDLGIEISLEQYQDDIFKMKNGLFINWEELNLFAKKPHQIIDIILLGCKDKSLIHRYESDKEKYETCDIVIEMIDSFFWVVFSKDEKLIQRLANKFQEIEFIDSDY